jgi:F0F1-type ATP synthase assembly protein I
MDSTPDAIDTSTDSQPLERSFSDRRPLTTTFLVIETSLLILAAVLFGIGDPMASTADTASVVGGLVTMLAIMMAVIGVLVYLGTVTVKLYARR